MKNMKTTHRHCLADRNVVSPLSCSEYSDMVRRCRSNIKGIMGAPFIILCLLALMKTVTCHGTAIDLPRERNYNGVYEGAYLNRVAFPVGGIGAGMFCLEGTGAISNMSVRNHPDVYNEPSMFAAISVKGIENGSKVLEGQVPEWKKFGLQGTGNGASGKNWGLPRFEKARFTARFPFAVIELEDDDMPMEVSLRGWSPFIPTDADNSSLPVGAIEYRFRNTSQSTIEAVFSYNTRNFMVMKPTQVPSTNGGKNPVGGKESIKPLPNGFVLSQEGTAAAPEIQGDFAIFTNEPGTVVDHCWFRGRKFDFLTMAWITISGCDTKSNPPVDAGAPGASLYVPFTLSPGETKVIHLMMAWYVPNTILRTGVEPKEPMEEGCEDPETCSCNDPFYKPWYSGKFTNINEVVNYWTTNYKDLLLKSEIFTNTFYNTTLPSEVTEAVAANLTILKSPTVLRQPDGKLWSWEGCSDNAGCCAGNCTHVWNYAQALPHLFPKLERTLRETEYFTSQKDDGQQVFRSSLPIRPSGSTFYAASDGQLGGIIKVYRDWRISGNKEWLKKIYPKVAESMDYCIQAWDPRLTGTLEEPHHNTYDIEFWGPDGMCTSFYLGALKAISEMGRFLNENVKPYEVLYEKGRERMETYLFDGEYFIQRVKWKGLSATDPDIALTSPDSRVPQEVKKLLLMEGPKYQYGTGCLADGVLGAWMAEVSGLSNIVDQVKTANHLNSVYKYNFKKDLSDHANPQRPTYALGHEGGVLLCSWPKGGNLSLPFGYSNEVWTGIEYQVASHLMIVGEVQKGLDIVRTCRDRYDGRVRNPFDEYECGHWYARAMSSYALLQGLTGVHYDAVDQVLYIDSRVGDFTSFLSTETGFGNVGLKDGKPFYNATFGDLSIKKFIVSGKEIR